MAKKNADHTEDQLASVEEALGKTEQFIEKNKNLLSYAIFGIVAIVLIVMAYNKYFAQPKELNAFNSMYKAEYYFSVDSFALALDGDGLNPGFLSLIDDFGSTKSGNLASYYAGICYLKLAQTDTTIDANEYYENAIDMLEDFSSDDPLVMPTALSAIGDALDQLGETEKAAKKFEEAAHFSDNKFTSPLYLLKAGIFYSELGDHDKALNLFEEIKTNYYTSNEGREIKKYIAQEKSFLGK